MANANSNSIGGIPAVTYYRMSTDEQATSIEAQRLLVERYAADHGYQLVGEYVDRGIPGDATADKRPSYLRMLADAAKGTFAAVLVRDTSRLTRSDSIDGAIELEPFKKHGVLIVTSTGMRIDLRTMERRILLHMGNEISNGENRNRAVAATNGQLQAALGGSWIGQPPYAMQVVGEKKAKRLEPIEEEAAIVRRMFRDYAAGATGEGIARGLNSDGLKTTKGNPWSRDTICHIMRNPVYCGDYFFNKGHYGKYQGIRDGKVAGDCKRGPHDASDMIIHRDHWLPIVDRPLWNRVQKLLDRNGVYKAPVDTFLLSSRVQCGSCEAERPMWGRTMRNGSRVYICEACGATVKESEAVGYVFQSVRRKFNPQTIARLEKELRKQLGGAPEDNSRVKLLERELSKQERKLVILDADMVAPVQTEIRRLRRELEESRQVATMPHIGVERIIRKALERLVELPALASKAKPTALRKHLMEAGAGYRVWTSHKGVGRRRRYTLERGEICLNVDTVGEEDSNLHLLGQSQAAYH